MYQDIKPVEYRKMEKKEKKKYYQLPPLRFTKDLPIKRLEAIVESLNQSMGQNITMTSVIATMIDEKYFSLFKDERPNQ